MAALKGIRILDLTLTLPGPYCTHLLADFGAEVIKVENPEVGGDWFRTEKPSIEGWGIRFLDLNRNKKSITLNLKSPKGKEIFSALARTSQVIVEGFRPGVVERLKLVGAIHGEERLSYMMQRKIIMLTISVSALTRIYHIHGYLKKKMLLAL